MMGSLGYERAGVSRDGAFIQGSGSGQGGGVGTCYRGIVLHSLMVYTGPRRAFAPRTDIQGRGVQAMREQV